MNWTIATSAIGKIAPAIATSRKACSRHTSLVHKFGKKGVDNFEEFIKEIEAQPSQTVGDIFVFVDECHRTQSGKLHRAMKAIMPNAVLIGFTGTPLLLKDKKTSLEVFGGYIHIYKFSEGVEDEVVLDLVYEARDIDQSLGSEDKIDAWFDAKTKGLNDWQKDELKKQWGTMQNVLRRACEPNPSSSSAKFSPSLERDCRRNQKPRTGQFNRARPVRKPR